MTVNNIPKFVTPTVSNVEVSNNKLKISFLNSSYKDVELPILGITSINDKITNSANYVKHEINEIEPDGSAKNISSFIVGRYQTISVLPFLDEHGRLGVNTSHVNQSGGVSNTVLYDPDSRILSMNSYQNQTFSSIFENYKLDTSVAASLVSFIIHEKYDTYEYDAYFTIPYEPEVGGINIINIDTGWNQIYGKLYFRSDGVIWLDVFTYNPEIDLSKLTLTVSKFKQVKLAVESE